MRVVRFVHLVRKGAMPSVENEAEVERCMQRFLVI